jgi:hypothetical protein
MNQTTDTNEIVMPPRVQTDEQLKAERIYRTALSSKAYLEAELECAQRTTADRKMTPFKLTQTVMTLYLNRKLIFIKDLPIDLQNAIFEFYQTKS